MFSLSEVSAELEPTASCPVDELTPSSLPGICKVYLDLIALHKDRRHSNRAKLAAQPSFTQLSISLRQEQQLSAHPGKHKDMKASHLH